MITKSQEFGLKVDMRTLVKGSQLELFHEIELLDTIGLKSNGHSKKQLNVVSLFSGAGGLDIGFKEAGFNCVLASDIMPQAEATFKFNYPETTFIRKDIRLLTSDEITESISE